ncbi:unnamed protein product [Caenorhabditis angaria]|uniref:Peptidase M13 C-terminal domain-containing protein n=1 Tax=Caenorhabditis angaria TaxID=860376 RepID=A0A9P1J553_9PELO|nr:unnamed protein product [Caenorhabditis angaria]
MYFYSYAAGLCDPRPLKSGPSHQAGIIRVNAVLAQIPDFAKVFGCGIDSPMLKTNQKQCVILGENAPIN